MPIPNKLFIVFLFIGGINLTSFAQDVPSKFRAPSTVSSAVTAERVALNELSKIELMSNEADVILTGRVVLNKSDWNENKTRIYTRSTLHVSEYLKGNSGSGSVEITSLGGEIGNVGELYSDIPKFYVNEEVLVFLKKDSRNADFKVLNGNEGKITIQSTSNAMEEMPVRSVHINSIKAQIKSYMESVK
ncbi:MAG: hypothetical protein CVV24_04725 [Ignavibacteriae bacterium HGW-Ignavibacteriae-3]|nr:MAG: hypothetical protein CVV24_04725 [Ignavibacteriae bacterium HGW-Ignavibacteriae-3]